MEVERVIEEAACRVTKNGMQHICPYFDTCGYQAQKSAVRDAQVIFTAHESLFHEAPSVIDDVGLLVVDEAFWPAGLRGVGEDAVLTLDGLRPVDPLVRCYGSSDQPHWDNTADLAAARGLLWKVLDTTPRGPLSVAALRETGLTPEQCRQAAGLEHRRLRDPGLLPGMDQDQRRERMDRVLPKPGEPWAPPGRAAAMWRLIAEALENDHDVGGAVVFGDRTENGTVRSLRLQWRADIRAGWGRDGPILHLDATLQPELVEPYISEITVAEPLMAMEPHVTVRQVLGAPTSAKALTPPNKAREREKITAANHVRDLATFIALRATELRGRSPDGADVLIIGQEAAILALQRQGLPKNVAVAHFNALSGMDRWRHVAGTIVIGRTLPAPSTVETLAAAISNRPTVTSRGKGSWWYRSVQRCIGLADGTAHALEGELHEDALAEAIRWTICEAELIQAIGRGRGVNRTETEPLQIDILSDVVLPIVVNEVLAWEEIKPSRHDVMAATGAALENAADMARAFPELWPSQDAARQKPARSVRNCYYKNLYNSQISQSSSVFIYRLAGAGQKDRVVRFDLAVIANPRAWLEHRLGPLAHFEMTTIPSPSSTASDLATDMVAMRERLVALGIRFDAAFTERIANDRASVAALSASYAAIFPSTAA